MLNTNWLAFLSFVVVTTFTPGPNNISSASMGILFGYRRTLKYLAGIITGFFFIMLLCGLISLTLLSLFPRFEVVLRIVGVGYILWLAYETLRISYNFDVEEQAALGFSRGLLLQVLNPKVIVYGLTLYTTFLAPAAQKPVTLIASALFLAGMAFCATSGWAILGSAIRRYLHDSRIQRIVNGVLALLLVYTALELSGLFNLLGK